MAAFLLRLVAETSRKPYALGLILSAIVLVLCAVRLTRVDPRISSFVRSHRVSEQYRVARRKRRGLAAFLLRLMAKTLTTYYALGMILPVIVLAVCAVRWVRVNPRISEFLRSPPVSERYRQADGSNPNDRREEMSPLVKQAELYAQYLAPAPVPKGAVPPVVTVRSGAPSPAPSPNFAFVTPKFTLHGTCYYPSRPEESVALVRQPGEGDGGTLQWVRQGDRLGHFVVDQIKHGAIVYRGGEQKHEMKVQPGPPQASLVRGHRAGAGAMSNGTAALQPVALSNKPALAKGRNEGQTVLEIVSDRYSWQELGTKPP